MITQQDVDYSEEIIENMTAEAIREIYADSLLVWMYGSGSGTGHPAGNYFFKIARLALTPIGARVV